MTYDPNRPLTTSSTEREIDHQADKAHTAVDRAEGKAHEASGAVREKAQDAKDKAQQVAGEAKDKAQELGAQASEQADHATTVVGERMQDAAQTIRERAPMSGRVGEAADRTADTLERAGSYLQHQNVNDMKSDLESLIRRHPMESLLIGLGIGYLLARSTRR